SVFQQVDNKRHTRAYTRLLRDTKAVNSHGLGRVVLISLNIEKNPRLVFHGDREMLRALAQSNLREYMRISDPVSRTVTMPLIDVAKIKQCGDRLERIRATTEVIEAELRPRIQLIYEMDPPNWWPEGVPYQSLYEEEMASHIDAII
ncbi:hypothetical protein PFISCL1PPCAC_3880, partial [Pristionchus fissidentatus]